MTEELKLQSIKCICLCNSRDLCNTLLILAHSVTLPIWVGKKN